MPSLLVRKLHFPNQSNRGTFPPLSKFKLSKTGLCPPLLQASPTLYTPLLVNVHPRLGLSKPLTDPQVHTTLPGIPALPMLQNLPNRPGILSSRLPPLTTRKSLALPPLGSHGTWHAPPLGNAALQRSDLSTFTTDCEFPAGRTCHFTVSSQVLGTLSYTE